MAIPDEPDKVLIPSRSNAAAQALLTESGRIRGRKTQRVVAGGHKRCDAHLGVIAEGESRATDEPLTLKIITLGMNTRPSINN